MGHLTREEVQRDLDRRRPGQSRITTPRNEADSVEIMSGLNPENITLGTPLAMLVRNKDQRSQDYLENDMNVAYRPSHADATYDAKYGVRAVAGGGRSSARETIGRVAAGAIAKTLLREVAGCEIIAWVSSVKDIVVPEDAIDHDSITMEQVEESMVRCPHEETSETMMSLPATKGFEVGSGFSSTVLTGSQHNDEFMVDANHKIRTRTNRSGGIQGGISNGENIVLHIAFKPTSTIAIKQNTVTREGEEVETVFKGRHDPCVVPRAVPMVDSMVALVLADQLLQNHAQCGILPTSEDTLPLVARTDHKFNMTV